MPSPTVLGVTGDACATLPATGACTEAKPSLMSRKTLYKWLGRHEEAPDDPTRLEDRDRESAVMPNQTPLGNDDPRLLPGKSGPQDGQPRVSVHRVLNPLVVGESAVRGGVAFSISAPSLPSLIPSNSMGLDSGLCYHPTPGPKEHFRSNIDIPITRESAGTGAAIRFGRKIPLLKADRKAKSPEPTSRSPINRRALGCLTIRP